MVRWTGVFLLALISLIAIVNNLRLALQWLAVRKRGSLVPLVGGVCGAVALLIVPNPAARIWWWLPLVLDPGSVSTGLSVAWHAMNHKDH